jgi:2-keto-4-pentenoate hydratase
MEAKAWTLAAHQKHQETTSMLQTTVHAALARELYASERTREQLEQFSKRYPGMEIADSYAIQREWIKLKLADGRRPIGHKIGLTSRAMQLASQITEPDYGTLLDDMLLRDGSEIEAARFIVPRFEVEFAFILARPLKGPGVTLFDVLNATDYVVPALELIDARIEQFDRETKAPRKVLDTIADNAANAAIVLGGRPMNPTRSTGAGPARCCSRTASSKSRAWARRCSATPATAWPGSPTSSRRTTRGWPPARSCSAARSRARCLAPRATPSMPTTGRSARSR